MMSDMLLRMNKYELDLIVQTLKEQFDSGQKLFSTSLYPLSILRRGVVGITRRAMPRCVVAKKASTNYSPICQISLHPECSNNNTG